MAQSEIVKKVVKINATRKRQSVVSSIYREKKFPSGWKIKRIERGRPPSTLLPSQKGRQKSQFIKDDVRLWP